MRPHRTSTRASLCLLAALIGAGCTSPNPRPPTLPSIEEGGPELPEERPPRMEPRTLATEPGAVACTLGDVDGDRVPDIALGVEAAFGSGAVFVVSGRSGALLFERRGAHAGERFGAAVAAAGDVDRDGINDLVVGAPGAQPSEDGRAFVVSGADGALLLELAPSGRAYGFGASVCGVGDMDGDGRPEVAVGSMGPELAAVFSSADGSVLLALAGAAQSEGTQVLGPGDLDADGHDELALGLPAHEVDGRWLGLVRVVSGADGTTLFETLGTVDSGRFGAVLALGGDPDHDGVSDLLVGAPPFHARVISGRDGSMLRELAAARGDAGALGFGASAATIGDLDDDGVPDYALGREDLARAQPRHALSIHGGAYGNPLGRLEFGVDRARVSAAGDLDRDGIGDLLVAFPELGLVRVYSGATMGLLLHFDPLGTAIDDVGMEVRS